MMSEEDSSVYHRTNNQNIFEPCIVRFEATSRWVTAPFCFVEFSADTALDRAFKLWRCLQLGSLAELLQEKRHFAIVFVKFCRMRVFSTPMRQRARSWMFRRSGKKFGVHSDPVCFRSLAT
jgi:hypothetical protein